MLPLEILPSRDDNRFVAILMGGFALFVVVVAIMQWPYVPLLTIILLAAAAGFGAWAVKIARRVTDPPVVIRLDESGITNTDWRAAPIPYVEITGARWLHLGKTTSLGLVLDTPEAHPPDKPAYAGVGEFNQRAYGVDVKVVISHLDLSDEEVIEAFIARSGIPVEGW